jgi:syntaxin 18
MPGTNRTADFREVLTEKQNALPEAKRRKLSGTPRHDTGGEHNLLGKEYVSEAYVIVRPQVSIVFHQGSHRSAQLNHITTLTRMLANIRKPYLNMDSRNPPLSRQGSLRNIDLAGSDPSWSGIRSLTNDERDQIDLQARVILSRCADRVKALEKLEKRRYLFLLSSAIL